MYEASIKLRAQKCLALFFSKYSVRLRDREDKCEWTVMWNSVYYHYHKHIHTHTPYAVNCFKELMLILLIYSYLKAQ